MTISRSSRTFLDDVLMLAVPRITRTLGGRDVTLWALQPPTDAEVTVWSALAGAGT